MNIGSDYPSASSYFKFAPLTEFDCDFKSPARAATPPTPSTPTINSKYIHGLNDYEFETEEFELNPSCIWPKKSLSLQSIAISDKENKHFSSNTPNKLKKRGRGRPKGSKNKNKKKKCKIKKKLLQLPNLKHIPKTVTQFELRLTPPYNTPPLTPIPPFWENNYPPFNFQIDSFEFPSDYHYNQTQSPSPNPLLIDHQNQVYSPPNYNNLPPPTQVIPIREFIENKPGKRAYYNMNTNNDQYNNANHPNKRRKITHNNNLYGTSAFMTHNNHLNVPGAIPQFQSENMNRSELVNNNNNMSISAGSENEPIISPHKRAVNNNNINHVIEEEEKHNITKRALFKEKLSNININANERNMNITPATAPNETNIASNLPVIGEQKHREHTHSHSHSHVQNNNNNNLELGVNDGSNGMIMDAVSAPILNHNNNSNLDWFGADENINTLNANNHFEMNMFPMGMGDDMKDMGLPNFMMNDIIPNQNDMMDMDIITNNNTNNGINHRVKQENNILPPPINTNNTYPPTNYHNNLPRFSISSSPPQPSSMFMDQINTNSSNIYTPNDYTYGSNNNIRSRSLQNGPNTLRPANLPTLRRSSSTTAPNNNNLGVEYVTKTAKSENNNKTTTSTTTAAAASRSHVLTPFDYPLSNELITHKKTISHGTHSYYSRYITNIKQEKPIHSAPLYCISSVEHNTNSNNSSLTSHSHSHSQRNSLSATPNPNTNYNFSLSSSLLSIPQHLTQNQHSSNSSFPPIVSYNDGFNDNNAGNNSHFNFLWWYPEVKFCELDPQLIPLP